MSITYPPPPSRKSGSISCCGYLLPEVYSEKSSRSSSPRECQLKKISALSRLILLLLAIHSRHMSANHRSLPLLQYLFFQRDSRPILETLPEILLSSLGTLFPKIQSTYYSKTTACKPQKRSQSYLSDVCLTGIHGNTLRDPENKLRRSLKQAAMAHWKMLVPSRLVAGTTRTHFRCPQTRDELAPSSP